MTERRQVLPLQFRYEAGVHVERLVRCSNIGICPRLDPHGGGAYQLKLVGGVRKKEGV